MLPMMWECKIVGDGLMSAATFKKNYYVTLKTQSTGPGWCGSGDRVLDWKPKGCQFNSQSRNMPGLQARFLVGGV